MDSKNKQKAIKVGDTYMVGKVELKEWDICAIVMDTKLKKKYEKELDAIVKLDE